MSGKFLYPRRNERFKSFEIHDLPRSASEETVVSAIRQQFKNLGDFGVDIFHKSGQSRTAFVHLKSFNEADAVLKSRCTILIHNRSCKIRPVFTRDLPDPESRYDRRGERPSQFLLPGMTLDRPFLSRLIRPFEQNRGKFANSSRRRDPEKNARTCQRSCDFRKAHPTSSFPDDSTIASRTLFVGNLDPRTTESDLRNIFSKYATTMEVSLKRPHGHYHHSSPSAFGFVTFENVDVALAAKRGLIGAVLGPHMLRIGFAKTSISPKIFIGGLGDWCTNYRLWTEFDRFGVIKSLEYNPGDTSAKILFTSKVAAEAAVQAMRGFPLGGACHRIRVDYCEHQDDLDSSLEDISLPATPEQDADTGLISLSTLLIKAPIVWIGGFVLKNVFFATQLHLIHGSSQVLNYLKDENGDSRLVIKQRLKLDRDHRDDITEKLSQKPSRGSVCLGIQSPMMSETQPLKSFTSYLKSKKSAAVMAITFQGIDEILPEMTLYCFPPCEFVDKLVKEFSDAILTNYSEIDYMLVVIV